MDRPSKTLVLFDFDGTLTTSDTLFSFTRFAVGDGTFFIGLLWLAVPMVLNKIKILSAQTTKELFLAHYFRGKTVAWFEAKGKDFAESVLPGLIRSPVIEVIESYKQKGFTLFIVSASVVEWIQPWAVSLGLKVLGTRLVIKDGKISGKISGLNCNGIEKVNRIKQEVDLTEFDKIIAYGDTSGDEPMLALAHERHFKPFRDRR